MFKKIVLLVVCLIAFVMLTPAKAVDPDTTWRNVLRTVVTTNGLAPAAVTNALAGVTLPAVNAAAATNIVNASISATAAISISKIATGGGSGSFQFIKQDGTTGTVYYAAGIITNSP